MGLPGLNQYLARLNDLAQGHNIVTPVRLEPAAPRSCVKHSTTELLRSLASSCADIVMFYIRHGGLDCLNN